MSRYVRGLNALISISVMLLPLRSVAADDSDNTMCSDSQSRSTDYGTYQLFNGYSGIVNGKTVGMTLTFHGAKVDGQVFVSPDFRNLEVTGEVGSHGDLTLTTTGDANKAKNNIFHGQFKELRYCESFEGTWDQEIAGIPPTGWSLNLSHTNSADEGKNFYSNLGVADDNQIDDNALSLQRAIVAKDKDVVAGMVTYPIKVIFGRKKETIKNSQQFLQVYDQIFIPFMVDEVRAAIPHHMFAKDEGALLDSEIWLDTTGKLTFIQVMGEPIVCEMAKNVLNGSPSSVTNTSATKHDTLCKKYAGSAPVEDPSIYETNYICDTPKHHIVVDSKADEVPRYRAWVKPHPMTVKPDMEIDRGTEEV